MCLTSTLPVNKVGVDTKAMRTKGSRIDDTAKHYYKPRYWYQWPDFEVDGIVSILPK